MTLVWLVLMLHAAWALVGCSEWLRFGEITGPITALRTFHLSFGPFAIPVLAIESGLGLLAFSRWWPARRARGQRVCQVLPLVVLIYSAVDAVACVVLASYADGVPHPRAFILKDQLPAILLPFGYLRGLIMWARYPVGLTHERIT